MINPMKQIYLSDRLPYPPLGTLKFLLIQEKRKMAALFLARAEYNRICESTAS